MSHEFRSPLDSILALSGLLLNRVDGELTEEQERQVGFVRRSADDLLRLVDDLLDTARVEAGQVAVHASTFSVADLFNSLRALIRPLVSGDGSRLRFDDPAEIPPLHTDEAKVAQILRNFISNALKFAEQGEIRISAALANDSESVEFRVADSGIGIQPEDQERIFQDFAQIDGPLQRRVRGTGLGLPLSRKLAELLGGSVALQSEPGRGSVFSVTIPRVILDGTTPKE
jgi:signal transduction histidine kinase